MDINDVPAMNEHPLSDLIEVASLKKLAVTKLALDLWRLNKMKMYSNQKYFRCEEMLQVGLPSSIKELIDERISLCRQELQCMRIRFGRFQTLKYLYIIDKSFESFTYGPDGKLCAERTAKNLLASPELTAIHKFEIACVYWFEDEIRRIWNLIYDHITVNYWSSAYTQILMHYWMAKMKIRFNDYYEQYFGGLVLNCSHYFHYFYNWSAFVHLLNTQDLERQYHFLSRFISYCDDAGIKYVLPKLNKAQVNYLLSQYPDRIIEALAIDLDGFERVSRIWNIVREIIDGESFSNILDFLCSEVYTWQTKLRERPTHLQGILLEVWLTAPNRLKMVFFGGHYVENFFLQLTRMDFKYRELCYLYDYTDERFISKLFADMPLEIRSRIWHSHWPGVVVHSSAEFQNQLLRLCLKEDDVIKRFVEEETLNFTKVRPIIYLWWTMELYDRIINYSKLCSWNDHLAREFRNKMFSSSIPLSLKIFNYDKLIKLEFAIDNCLTTAEEAKDVKRTIFFSKSVEKILKLKLRVGFAKDVVGVVDRFIPTERSLHEKQFFLNQWSKFLTFDRNRKFDDRCWKEFLSWWLNNEDDLPIFKKFLPVDRNLEKLLLEAVELLLLRLGPLEKKRIEHVSSINCKIEEFTRVDNFLNWYFGDEAAVRDYKRSKIMNYRQTTVIKNLLLSRKHECIFDYILVWFFNGDVTRIGNFRRKYNRKKHVV